MNRDSFSATLISQVDMLDDDHEVLNVISQDANVEETFSVLDWARRYVGAGFSVIPVRVDGSKSPAEGWKNYMTRIPTDDELVDWFENGASGIGIVGGGISGNLERIDFDAPGVFDEWVKMCRELGLAQVAKECPIVKTPREGGFHIYYRCLEAVDGNQKLAQDSIEDAENGESRVVTLVETRGEGGYTVAPGSPADCHETGGRYQIVYGDILHPPVLSAEERSALLGVARALNRFVSESDVVVPSSSQKDSRPGDDYNARNDWRVLLESRGWACAGDRNGVEYWRRPGKNEGVSATFNYAGSGLFYVFTTNAHPLKNGKGYSPFAIYAILEHNDDFKAAAKALSGFGRVDISTNLADSWDATVARVRIEHAIQQGTAVAIYKVVDDLARMPLGDRSDLLQEIKNACSSIDLRELKGEISRTKNRHSAKTIEQKDERPLVIVGDYDLRNVGDEVMKHLEVANTPPSLFVRSGRLCAVIEDENGNPGIRDISCSDLVARVAKCCAVVKDVGFGFTPTTPPNAVADYVLAEGSWSFPALEGITESPTVRRDGTVAQDAGYDLATRLFYKPTAGFDMPAIPDIPGAEDVKSALDTIDDILCDFPFVDVASKTNFIALLLSTVIRPAINGQVPLALLDAPTAGTGKSLLSAIVGIIATGRYPQFTTAPKNEEEWCKKLTAILFSGQAVVILDNVKYMLNSDDLAAVLTSRVWSQRLFGKNTELVTLPNKAVWVATGNNIQIGGDIARRCYWIRLDPEMAKPHERTGFRHPDLTHWVEQNRGQIIAALLTLYRAWHAAGKVIDTSIPVVGSFEEWAKVVGSILSHAGIQEFLGNRDQLWDQADNESGEWEAFLSAWVDKYGTDPVRVKQITQDVSNFGSLSDAIPTALADAFEGKTQNAAKKIGWAFKNRLERRYGKHGLRLVKGPDTQKVATWRVLFDSDPRTFNAVISSELKFAWEEDTPPEQSPSHASSDSDWRLEAG